MVIEGILEIGIPLCRRRISGRDRWCPAAVRDPQDSRLRQSYSTRADRDTKVIENCQLRLKSHLCSWYADQPKILTVPSFQSFCRLLGQTEPSLQLGCLVHV
eukprot:1327697-Amorphochlora_amoeboformis.AAC.2